jgi:ketosteroid isomerase-like protein
MPPNDIFWPLGGIGLKSFTIMRWFVALAVVGLLSTNTQAQAGLDERQIRAARAEFNAAIARHDVPAILSFLEQEYRASVSSGEFRNREEMGNAFAARFAEFKDALYVRTPDSVQVSSNGAYASETGRWVGSWTTPSGPFRTGGRYAAYWRKTNGRWLLHAELYVPLFCEGAGCK